MNVASWEGAGVVLRPNPKVSIGTASPYQHWGRTDFADQVGIDDSVEHDLIEQLRSTLLTLPNYVNADLSVFRWRDPGDLYIVSEANRPVGLGAGLVSSPADIGVVYASSGLRRTVGDLSEALVFDPVRSDQGSDYSLSVRFLTYPIAETGHDASSTVRTLVTVSPGAVFEGIGTFEGDGASVARGLLTSQEYELREEIRSYTDLSDDWDADGAIAPCQQAIDDALAFLASRPFGVPLPLPEVATIGDVGIYWDRGGVFVEVQFGGDGAFSYYAELRQGRTLIEEYGRDGLPVADSWPDDMVRLLRQLDPS